MSYEQRAWFDRVVPMLDNRIGGQRNVSNAVEAADILINHWPTKRGKSHKDARMAVLEALRRYRDREAVRKARDAFAKAVKDAGVAGYDD